MEETKLYVMQHLEHHNTIWTPGPLDPQIRACLRKRGLKNAFIFIYSAPDFFIQRRK